MKNCNSCVKARGYKCIALKEQYFKTEGECFAWSNDPNWLKNVNREIKDYSILRKEIY